MLYLGCSGWSYPDWGGVFYPSGEKDRLSYYIRMFSTVEINTTFYRIPDRKVFMGWAEKAVGKAFKYSVKFPGEVTHKLLLEDPAEAARVARDFERDYISPMGEVSVLAAVLIQLPPHLGRRLSGIVSTLLQGLDTARFRYFVEPRHSSIVGSSSFRDLVRAAGAEVAELDGPMSVFSKVNSEGRAFYLRLHGRNNDIWYTRTEDPAARYRYEYSAQELEGFSTILKASMDRYEDAYVYFNNHPGGRAPRNALSMLSMLGMAPSDPQARLM